MRDLRDGESVDVTGSTGATYTIKNVGGVYACSCPAWRTQSLPVDQRTCKHLRKLRGDAAEDARIGGPPAPKPAKASAPPPKPAPLPVPAPALTLPAPAETEAVVLEYHTSKGRFDGLRCRLGDGQPVGVAAGFGDKERDCPPPVGGIVALRFPQVSATGVPCGASYAGVRADDAPTLPLPPRP
ncbi:MAG: hypothetical protein K2X82_03850 [Gemmataceae bacterium]|nr:hypothetical protein [Gemmataceae bacterium]